MAKIIEGKTLNYNIGTMNQYSAHLNRLINPMLDSADNIILSAFDDFKHNRITESSLVSRLNTQLNEEEETQLMFFMFNLPIIYSSYINALDKNSVSNVRKNTNLFFDDPTIISNPEKINPIKDASRNDFTNSILSSVAFYFSKLKNKTSDIVLAGNTSGLNDYLSSQRRITKKRSKSDLDNNYRGTFNALNNVRLLDSGLSLWDWIYTYRSKTERPYHVNVLRGKRFNLNKTPPIIDPKTKQRGLPGQLIHCKCRMRPVIAY